MEPYPKPIILNHDLNSEPIGRVMAAKMDKEQDGSMYVRLQIAITDPVAIEKVMDKRYLTGSVGGRAGRAVCSISGDDLASESSDGKPKFPKYKRGQIYKGKLAFIDMQDIAFKEYSFVNQPADSKSGVRSASSGDAPVQNSSDSWVARSSAFVLSMDEEDIFSVTENQSFFKGVDQKESKPLYLHLKGAFLAAMAIHESETYKDDTSSLLLSRENKDNEESSNMSASSEEDNVLAVVESLSEETVATQVPDAILEVSNEVSGSENPKVNPANNESENTEISNDNSEKADEQEIKDVESEKAEEPKEQPEVTQAETQEEPKQDNSLNSEDKVATESEQSDVLEKVKALEEENIKLKNALHNTLVERVVDAKISVGLESLENREAAINDHKNRSASSLADSLRDMAKMPQAKNTKAKMPEIASETEVVEGEKNAITLDDENKEEKSDDNSSVEQLFVDTLMGRRKL